MPAKKSINDENAEMRKDRERLESIRRDVARLQGRMDIIETFLKLDIKTWKPTEQQKRFAEQHGVMLPDALEADDYDYAADDQNFNTAKERAARRR